jgi:hypothetical protein
MDKAMTAMREKNPFMLIIIYSPKINLTNKFPLCL